MHFPADGIGVVAGGGDQKVQRLHARVTAALGHNVKKTAIRLCVQLVENDAMCIETVLVSDVGAEHLIVTPCR
ncbi:hypothetical protein SDC9_151073 [bioreactor metagenome]|uniref:Uncharacterized protein n=1 Tax=bioreactor metagenome TaxID=1076179 RepID=A0A645ERM9_9ZZZZ